jgi:hypothetical protein
VGVGPLVAMRRIWERISGPAAEKTRRSDIVSAMLIPLLVFAFASSQPQGTYVATVFGPGGGELVEQCRNVVKMQRKETADAGAAGQCLSFVAEVIDGGQFAASGNRQLFPICFPPDVDGFQLSKIVVKYGDDHPEKLNNGATYIVMNALRDAFPCSKKYAINTLANPRNLSLTRKAEQASQ